MAAPVFLSHPASLEHDTYGHPERPERMVAIERELDAHGWLGLQRAESVAVDVGRLTAVHAPRQVTALRELSEAGGGMVDADTLLSAGSWLAARHAAGGACDLVDRLLSGAAPSGISAHRPPGHHAEHARAMGFCLFNNVAVAAQHAIDAHALQRVLILDWDVHHGNGTNDIFHASSQVMFASIHQSPLYPGTGAASDIGAGAGRGYTLNLPVSAGADDGCFASLVEHVVLPAARTYAPQLLLVSAGYDGHAEDPLAECELSERGYALMTGSLRRLAAELQVPLGVVLEGGYALGALARSVRATLEVLVAADPPPDPGLPVHPVAFSARERLARQGSAVGGPRASTA